MKSANQPFGARPFLHGWRGRALAVVFGLSLFVVAELVCLLFGWGRMTDYDDPFVGFSEIHPLFVRDIGGEHHAVAPSRRKFFPPESFPAHKPTNGFRIFCLGGSTVQGNPYSKDTSFTTWLEMGLRAADPSRDWEVINCGGISYASYRLAPILKECLAYQPDLFIVCTGHNEFLEDRAYQRIKHAPQWLSRMQEAAAQLRTYTLLRAVALKPAAGGAGADQSSKPKHTAATDSSAGRPVMNSEVDPWLDYHGGLKVYHRDEEWRRGVIAHFENNLRRMATMARHGGVPVVFVRPPSNLRDCPPFKSEHRAGLTEAELSQWEALTAQTGLQQPDRPEATAERLRRAIAIDDQYAATFYSLGKCYEALGRPDLARDAYLKARELDVCPLRMIEPLEQSMAAVAKKTRTPLVDAQQLLERESRLAILGDDLLLDHVHPSIHGHQEIATALMETMGKQGWVRPQPGWTAERDELWQRQLASLDEEYYRAGRIALAGLRAWTEGRASGLPVEYRVLAGKPSGLGKNHP